jgi:hypothetical protein
VEEVAAVEEGDVGRYNAVDAQNTCIQLVAHPGCFYALEMPYQLLVCALWVTSKL